MNTRKARVVLLVLTALLWLLAFGQVVSAADPAVTVIVHVAIAPTVSSTAATGVTSSTALLHGNIDDDGNVACTVRGFQWGLISGNYTYSWNETGAFHEGAFTHTIGSLPLGTQIFWIAFATNPIGSDNSSERSFWTLSLPLAPTNFQAEQTGINQVTLTWTMGIGATNTTIRVRENDPPTSLTEGYEVYNGGDTSVNVTMTIDELATYGFSAWSENAYGVSLDYATARIGGDVSLAFIALLLLPLGLTVAMFATKNSLLGFPSGIFWGVLGGYSYLQSVSTWDWQYILFFASIGMVIFSILAAYTLRTKDLTGPDTDRGAQFIDEGERRADDVLWGENIGW
jgi:hypothetical protein